ncbi:uncharacterized protein [Lolium perenne]|uniref:uncharacterized protein n=1 Tax=Lolium perenne TaxID=4522 RepID=UPI003A9905E4
MPLRDLFAQMLSTEQRVERRKALLHGDQGGFQSAHAIHRGGGGKPAYRPDSRGGSDPRNYSNNNTSRPNYFNKPTGSGSGPRQGDRGDYRSGGGDRPNYDRGARPSGGSGGGGNRPICQICDKPGHKASSCFKRFKQDYLGVDNDGRYMDRQVAAASTHGQTSSYSVDSGWYMDTGATDHLTNQLDKLTVKENYNGNDQVHAANGHGPTHQGNSS